MHVTIQYAAQARSLAGRACERVDLDVPRTVRDVLGLLAEKHVKLRHLLLTEQGQPHPSLLLCVGDEQVDSGRMLHAGDVLSILPPIAGG